MKITKRIRIIYFILLIVSCVIFRNCMIISIPLLTLNTYYMYVSIGRERKIIRVIARIANGLAGLYIASIALADSMPKLPRFVARPDWSLFGHDQYAVLWFLFWVSYGVLAVLEIVCVMSHHRQLYR